MVGYQSKKMVTNRHADPETVDHIIRLRKENERLVEVIRFYGNPKNWETKLMEHYMGDYEYTEMERDEGKMAREILKELQK